MEGNYSDHTSATDLNKRNYMWVDQYDTKTEYVHPTQSSRSKIKDKLEDGFEKSKAVASTGLKKIERGSVPRSSPRLHRFLRFHFKCFLCISSICKDLPLLISPRLKTPISSERVGSDFEWVPSSPRSLFNCNLREPLPSASSAAASACPFYFVNNNRIATNRLGQDVSSFGTTELKGEVVATVCGVIESSVQSSSPSIFQPSNPELRHLDVAGMKSSKLYLLNGIAMFLGWLVREASENSSVLQLAYDSATVVLPSTDFCTSTRTTQSSLPNSHQDLSHSLTPMLGVSALEFDKHVPLARNCEYHFRSHFTVFFHLPDLTPRVSDTLSLEDAAKILLGDARKPSMTRSKNSLQSFQFIDLMGIYDIYGKVFDLADLGYAENKKMELSYNQKDGTMMERDQLERAVGQSLMERDGKRLLLSMVADGRVHKRWLLSWLFFVHSKWFLLATFNMWMISNSALTPLGRLELLV
ncbi:hypothetical protein LXL04_034866 [Taraxacum kok-saghyz]